MEWNDSVMDPDYNLLLDNLEKSHVIKIESILRETENYSFHEKKKTTRLTDESSSQLALLAAWMDCTP